MIKVSVIIPCYNMEAYLEECLDSVCGQTLVEKEIICINDGSTDNTPEILHRYQLQFNNLVIQNQENSGVSAARNNGLAVAQGEFVAFMDPDDFYPDKDVLEYLYQKAKENEVLICGGSMSILKDGLLIADYNKLGKDRMFAYDKKMNFREYHFYGGFTRYIYNKDFLINNNIYFPLYNLFEDPPFFVKALASAEEFYTVKKVTYCYRKGHKEVFHSINRVTDYAKGLIDVLYISKVNSWNLLHADTVSKLLRNIRVILYSYVTNDSLELNELINIINHTIEKELLPKDDPDFRTPYLLEPSEIIIKKEELLRILRQYAPIVIYGAGYIGNNVAEFIRLLKEVSILCFAVTKKAGNPDVINGIPVKEIAEILPYKETALILIATRSNLWQEIRTTLEEQQFKNIMTFEL